MARTSLAREDSTSFRFYSSSQFVFTFGPNLNANRDCRYCALLIS